MIIDIAFGLTVVVGFLYGYSKGLIKTLFSILSILIAIIAAMKLSPLTINAMDTLLPNAPRLAYIIGFLLTFILVIIIIRFIGNKIESLLKVVNLNFMNKIAGGSLIAVFFILIFSCVIWFLNEARLISEPQKDQSIVYYTVEPIPGKAREQFEVVKPVFKDFNPKEPKAIVCPLPAIPLTFPFWDFLYFVLFGCNMVRLF